MTEKERELLREEFGRAAQHKIKRVELQRRKIKGNAPLFNTNFTQVHSSLKDLKLRTFADGEYELDKLFAALRVSGKNLEDYLIRGRLKIMRHCLIPLSVIMPE